jgi:filamentous hemagglutinin
MPIRDRILWGGRNPLSDPRYADLDQYVSEIRRGKLRPNVKGGSIFANKGNDLLIKPYGYYTEYDVEPTAPGKDRGRYRIVLGRGGEVYITGNHYRDFRQIINMPQY